jgi:tetratricopeptide (TPR) repeat protein
MGDRNQPMTQMSDSTAIANIETLILQQLPQSPESARYSLPIEPTDFTGREAKIQQIKTDLSTGQVVSIVGMAGVGKSALAVRVAHQLKDQFPSGQIYLNLRGADTHPLTVESALETLLRALGVDPVQIPTELSNRAALYRSRIAQSPTLVVLDNAANAQQVKDLLPGASACLITSRQQLEGLASIKTIDLEGLPDEQALELLRKVLPPKRLQAEARAVRAIVGYCGGLPLALRIVAATLMMPSWQGKRLADYAQQLANERQQLGLMQLQELDIRASFELSYRELEPAAANLLGWLGLLPGDFSNAILLPLIEEPAELMQTALAALVDGRLVDPLTPDAERYVLHDLMRLFALEKLKTQAEPATVQATKVRLVRWCRQQANTWENALNPGRRRQWAETLAADWATGESEVAREMATAAADLEPRLLQSALSWFEAERETLVQAFAWAAETQQWQVSLVLAENLTSFFGLRGYWGDWVSTHRQALATAQQAGDIWGEGQSLNSLGSVYQEQGKWHEAIDCYEQSLQICRTIGDVPGEGLSLNNLGNVYQEQGKWHEAIDCYEQFLQICRTIGDVQGEGLSLIGLGNVYQDQGKWSEAIDCHEQSLQIYRAISDIQGESRTLNSLGQVCQNQGKWQEAIDCYEQSLQICRTIGDVPGEGLALNSLGNVYRSQGKWSEAIDRYEQSLLIKRTSGDVQGEGLSLNSLGNVYQAQGNWNEAFDCYEQSLQLKRVIGDVQGEGLSLNSLGNVYRSQGKWSEALDCYEQSLQICRVIGDVQGEALSLNSLGNIYRSQGKWHKAIDCYEQSLQIKRAIGDVQGEGLSLNSLGQVYQEQGKWNEAFDCYEQSLHISRAIGDGHGKGLSLANLGVLYRLQKHLDRAIPLWRKALTKLHPDSPEYATVTQWLQADTQPRCPAWLDWLLPLAILLFLAWNLVNGHWNMALLGGIALIGWQWGWQWGWRWYRRRR